MRLIIFLILLISAAFCSDSLIFQSSFGKFQNAVSISTSREEFIFVSDISVNRVYKLSADGTELANFGGSGLGINELNQPYSVDASNGLDVLVADYQNNRIKRLDIKLNYISQFDFNAYNLTAESSDKIYNPKGIASHSTGEVFVICDATNHKAAKISEFTELKLLFGSNTLGYDKLDNPVKIVRGSQLDVWILDKTTNEILNYNNFGTFVRKITPKSPGGIISIAFYNDILFILADSNLTKYDLKTGQYSKIYNFVPVNKLTDVVLLDKNTVLLLSTEKINKYKLINQ